MHFLWQFYKKLNNNKQHAAAVRRSKVQLLQKAPKSRQRATCNVQHTTAEGRRLMAD